MPIHSMCYIENSLPFFLTKLDVTKSIPNMNLKFCINDAYIAYY